MAIEKRIYWAADDSKKLAESLSANHGSWSIWGSNPVQAAWIRNSIAYYSPILEPEAWDTSLVFQGDQGELVKMSVPHARILIRQMVSLLTRQKLAFSPVARKSGINVMKDMRVASAKVEQLVVDERLDQKQEILVEQALVLGSAYIDATWKTDKGLPVAGDQSRLYYEGKVDISIPSVYDVFFDYAVPEFQDLRWVEIRRKVNRYDLLASHPDLESEILALPSANNWQTTNVESRVHFFDDMVYVYEFYHIPCPALPVGRMTFYGDSRTIFFDGPNLYEKLPIEQLKPAPIFGMGLGYAPFSDLLPCQEMYDHSMSAWATNQAAHAVQNVTVPRSAGINVQEIGGMNFISYTPQNVPGGGKPEALQLTKTAPETIKFAESLESVMEKLSNVNSALRGSPPPGVTSGVAIATLSVNAYEFIDSTGKSIAAVMSRTMHNALNAEAKFARGKRSVRVKERSGQVQSVEYTGEELANIEAVEMVQVNPLMKTMSGKVDIAEKMVQSGLIKNVQQYISILDGAPLDTLGKDERSENELLESENERLRNGQQTPVLATDNHGMHVRCHLAILNDPMMRENDDIVRAVTEHVAQHRTLAEQADPMLQMMAQTGQTPPPQAAGMPPGAQPPPGGPGASGPANAQEAQLPPGPREQGLSTARPTPAKPAEDMISEMAGA